MPTLPEDKNSMETLELNGGGVVGFAAPAAPVQDDPIVPIRLSAWVHLVKKLEALEANQTLFAKALEKLILTTKAASTT